MDYQRSPHGKQMSRLLLPDDMRICENSHIYIYMYAQESGISNKTNHRFEKRSLKKIQGLNVI